MISYPKWKYSATAPAKIVHSADEEVALGEGWEDTPEAFVPKPQPIVPEPEPTPTPEPKPTPAPNKLAPNKVK